MTAIRQSLTIPQFDFACHPARYPAIIAGFGAGKTQALICRLLAAKLAYPGGSVAYYAPTYDLIRLIAWPRFAEMLTAWGLGYTLNKSENRMQITGFGDVFFRTLDNPERIVGYEVADSGVDELDTLRPEQARDAWNRIIARNRQKKPGGAQNSVAVATTPEGFRFVYQRWHREPTDGYAMVRATTASNAANLPDDYIDALRASYPEPLLAAYLDGQFVNLASGAVYPEFDRTLNHTGEMLRENEPLHIGMDFNVHRMAAVVGVIRDGQPRILDELTEVRDTPTMIEHIRARYAGRSITIYPDASGGSTSSKGAAVSDLSLLRHAGFSINAPRSNPPIRDRVIALNAMLRNGTGERRLLINTERCTTLTEALEQQAYDKAGLPDKSTGMDHVTDALGYLIHRRYPINARADAQKMRLVL